MITFFLFVLLLQLSELRAAQRPQQVDKEGTLMPYIYIHPHHAYMSMVLMYYIYIYIYAYTNLQV